MSNKNTKRYRKRRERSTTFPILIILTVLIGAIIAFKAFSMVYEYVVIDSEAVEPDDEDQFSANDMVDQVQSNLIGSDIDGVIKAIDNATKKITFYSLKSNETIVLGATDDTKFDSNNSFGDLRIGDVITFVYDKDRNLSDIKKCENAWEFSDTGLVVNADARLVKFGDLANDYKDKAYKYTDGVTTVRYKNSYVELSSISPLDLVTIRGYDNGRESKVYSITIEKSHGSLVVNNFSRINDPTIKIADREPIAIPESGKLDLYEGSHNVIVSGSNCEPLEKTIVITPQESATIDLSNIQIKTGVLTIHANVSDYQVSVDGVSYPANEPIMLDYGSHKVVISKAEYLDFTKEVRIEADTNNLDAKLEEKDKFGSIEVTVNPGSAKIYIDGDLAGISPQTKKVILGSHTITVKLDGYIDETKTVVIANEGDVVTQSFDMTPLVSAYVATE